jgi:hypothetical protein
VVQDYGLSIKAVTELQEMMEEEWLAARLEAGKRLEIAQLEATRGLCVEKKLPR